MKPTTKETKTESTNNKISEDHTFHGKTHDEIKEIIQNLEAQEAQQLQTIQTAQSTLQTANTMLLKIQGALDLSRQMIPQETEK